MITLDHKQTAARIASDRIRKADLEGIEEARIRKVKRRISTLIAKDERYFDNLGGNQSYEKYFNAYDRMGNIRMIWVGAMSREMASICKDPEAIKWAELKIGSTFTMTVNDESLEFICVERPESVMIFDAREFGFHGQDGQKLANSGFQFVVAETRHGLPTNTDPENYIAVGVFGDLGIATAFAFSHAKQKEST